MSTIKEVAKLAGVSPATISKYLSGTKVKPKNKENIDNAIKELDFTLNTFASGLRTNRSMTIGVLIPELDNQFSTSIISKIENTVIKHGYSTIICDCKSNGALEENKLSFLISKKCDALVIMPYHLKARKIQELKMPVVLIDRIIDDMDCDSVLVDNIEASYNVVMKLIKSGHEDIAILCGPDEIYTVRKRLQGYKKAFSDSDLEIKNEYIFHGEYDVKTGHNLTNEILKMEKRPTAIYATNSELTLGAVISLSENNMKIPDDISFIGFDNLDIAKVMTPKLSVVTQPIDEIGELVGEILIDRLFCKNEIERSVKILKTSMFMGKSVKNLTLKSNAEKEF